MKILIDKLCSERVIGRAMFYGMVFLGAVTLIAAVFFLSEYKNNGSYETLEFARECGISALGVFSIGFGFDFIMSDIFERKSKKS